MQFLKIRSDAIYLPLVLLWLLLIPNILTKQETLLTSLQSFSCVKNLTVANGNIYFTDSKEAHFYQPSHILALHGNLYITDNTTIRKLELASGKVSTFAGQLGVRDLVDAEKAEASFYSPRQMTSDGINLYVAYFHPMQKSNISSVYDTNTATIRKVLLVLKHFFRK